MHAALWSARSVADHRVDPGRVLVRQRPGVGADNDAGQFGHDRPGHDRHQRYSWLDRASVGSRDGARPHLRRGERVRRPHRPSRGHRRPVDGPVATGVGGQSVVKFTIPQFDRPADAADLAHTYLMDGNFYDLHDEWYYYRLLNGQPIPGADVVPAENVQQFVSGRRDLSVGAQRAGVQFAVRPELPRRAAVPSGLLRLGAPRRPTAVRRRLGRSLPDPVGGRPDHWLIELEYSDAVTPAIVAQFFATRAGASGRGQQPAGVGGALAAARGRRPADGRRATALPRPCRALPRPGADRHRRGVQRGRHRRPAAVRGRGRRGVGRCASG